MSEEVASPSMSSPSLPSSSSLPSSNPSQIVLACEIPLNQVPGTVFHVRAPDDRFFEVVMPEGCKPGDTINIVVPLASDDDENANLSISPVVTVVDPNSVFGKLAAFGSFVNTKAKALDEQYKITDKATAAGEAIKQKAVIIDEQYKISEKAKTFDEQYKISETTNKVATNITTKAHELNEKHQIIPTIKATGGQVSENTQIAGGQIIACASQIDSKYAVSATVARIVNAGAAAIIAAYNKAVEIDNHHKITERAKEAAAKVAAKAKEIDEKYEVSKKIEDTTTKAINAVQTQFQKMTSKPGQPQAPGDGNGVSIEELPIATPVNDNTNTTTNF